MTGPGVVVVGAGLAGLAAAVALRADGARVHLAERSRLLGGKATSFRVGDIEVDNGQHVVLRCCTEFVDFATELGMAGTLHFQPRFSVTVLARDRAPQRLSAARLPAPLHLAAGFLRYGHLGAGGKLRVARALLAARRDRGEPGATMAAWLAGQGQDAATRRAFWDPFLVPALNAPLEQVTARDGLFVVRTAFLGAAGAACIGYSTVPLARLAERAAAACEQVSLRTAVTDLVVRDGAIVGVRTAAGATIDCDACVLAVPPRRAAALLATAAGTVVAGLDAFTAEAIVDVHLWYDRVPRDLEFAALLDSPVQWVFAKGDGHLCCSLSSADSLARLSGAELAALCDAELRGVLPELRGVELLRSACTRDPEATFVPRPGLRRPGNATPVENLVLAGAYTDTGWPATMESAVRSGRAAAATLMRALHARPAAAREHAHAV